MSKLNDLFDQSLLGEMISGGFVRVQHHPDLPLSIFNYTEKAAYEHVWNLVTTTCRGLITNRDTGDVVARPFGKFFNYGERLAAELDLAAPVVVSDKADGSLGVLYSVPSGWAVATRGSFTSDQARHATALFNERYADWQPPEGVTVLFEIVYPDNRIVLDYDGMDDLILLGAIDTDTGGTAHPLLTADWPGPRVEVFPYSSLAEALAAESRPNAEGLVVRFVDTDQRVKLKQADYVAMHRIVTGFTARRLWERAAVHAVLAVTPDVSVKRLAQNLRLDVADAADIVDAGPDWLDQIRELAPEEFLGWIDTTVARLHAEAAPVVADVLAAADRLMVLPRQQAAAQLVSHPYRGMVFAALDGKDITAQAWASIYPAHEKPYWTRTEDAA